jgi:hypothetical protein
MRSPAVNTDDRNLVEFAFARSLSGSARFNVVALRRAALALGADRPTLEGIVDWDRVARQRVAIYLVAGAGPPSDPEASEAERIRAEAVSQYLSGDLAGAVKTLSGLAAPLDGPVETTVMAEGLADVGDSRAVPYIKRLRDLDLTEAEAATARLAFRLGQYDVARGALVSALVRYRTDPWPSQVSMSHALTLADELTLKRPDMANTILDALGRPFAVAALEQPRRLIRVSVESHSRTLSRCQEVLPDLEPYIPWRADVLRYRADCYRRTADSRALEALSDLERYRSQETKADPAPR